MDYTVAPELIKQFVARIERLEEDKAAIQEDLRQVYQEAKSEGFDVGTLKQVVKIRKKDKRKVEEEETLLEIYKEALGMH